MAEGEKMNIGKIHKRLVAMAAAAVLAVGAGFVAPGVAMADDTSASSASNVEQALKYLDYLNKNVRGIKRSKALTNQQIADANTDMTADDVQDGTGTDAVLPALKVNSDITKWAQTRADELAAKDDITHANMYNGVPEWATFTRNGYRFPSTFNSPNYVGGKQAFGSEALAIWTTGSGANPIDMWASELDTAEEGYGH